MVQKDLLNRDASYYASSELSQVISSERKSQQKIIPKVTAEEAMSGASVLEFDSSRDVTRVLFISRDTGLLNPTQQSLDGYVDLSDLFDEVHILILREGIPPKYPVLRVEDNVWLYTATAKSWWSTPSAGMEVVENELEFASGFRVDLIVARDPFESAYLANKLAEKYGRATQLHILDDYTSPEFIKKNKLSFWRLLLPKFTIPKFASVRTQTNTIQEMISKNFTVPDLATLPRYQNYEELIDLDKKIDLKEKYKPFIFFMAFVGHLDHKSTLHQIIDASYDILRNPRVGLLVFGDGPAKGEFERKIKSLGLEGQVVFETKVKDIVPYLKSSHILLVSDTDFESEEIVLKGAAAGISMILSRTDKRDDVFVNGESAFLCEPDDVESFKASIDELLNNIELRQQFIQKSQMMIRRKFFADPKKYIRAYRASVEEAFFAGEEKAVEDEEKVN